MANLEVHINLSGRKSRVDALPFLPGLYVHKPPQRKSAPDVYNITHGDSGLAILTEIPEKYLEVVRMILGRMTWDRPARIIYYEPRYKTLIEEAMAVTTKADSEKQEKRIEADVEGRRQPASGSRWGFKRDIITESVLIEAKITNKKSYRLNLRDLSFLRKQAYSQGKIPAYVVSVFGLEDVAILPAQEFGEQELSGIRVESIDAGNDKGVAITVDMCSKITSRSVLKLKTKHFEYLIIGYEHFLEKAKRGVS